MHFLVIKDEHCCISLFLTARSLARGHRGRSWSFRKLPTAGDYIPRSAYKGIGKAAEKVNSITSGVGGGDEQGGRGGGGEESQMKFKLAPSPATNLKQYSERKPKRKEKQRGVCGDTLCARAHQAAAESARRAEVAGRGFGSHLRGSAGEQNSLQQAQSLSPA